MSVCSNYYSLLIQIKLNKLRINLYQIESSINYKSSFARNTIPMDFFTQIFQNKIDKFLKIDNSINPKYVPESLLKALKSKEECKYLKKKLNSKTHNIYKILKRLSICSLVLIYSNKFYDLIADIQVVLSGNIWIDKEFIQPYYMFLKKLCFSNEMYQNTKKLCPMPIGKNMEMLFYNIGLLKMLFRIVAKMPLLGRYYKPKNEMVVSAFINTIAVHAQKLYISFRQILGHMIQNPRVHIPTKQDQIMMKAVLRDQLPQINQQIKKIFLDKYFYPLGKGIGIKLFRPQQQTQQNQKVIMGIISDHQNTNRQKMKSELQITLFPESGIVNMRFYEQTLMSNMILGEAQNDPYQEEVAQIDAEAQIDSGEVSIEKRFKIPNKAGKISENQIETGIQRFQQSLSEI